MYKKERYSFYILFTLKAACGLAYRPQAAFAFDRYLLFSQVFVWLYNDGVRRRYAAGMQHQPESRDAVLLATLPQPRTHAMARLCWPPVDRTSGAAGREPARSGNRIIFRPVI